TAWATAAAHRPVMAEMFEKLFISDADLTYGDRHTFLSVDGGGTLKQPSFKFGSGSAQAIRPYCLEEYNSHLFVGGYGSEDTGDDDRPEMLRHSWLGRSADDVTSGAEGFDKEAWLMLGQKGVRVTGLRKGRGLLLAAKRSELYRISGFGRAYPGWQFSVEGVNNSLGMGVTNPYALAYAGGFWYGLGAQGPFRTDGFLTESLVGPRQREWRAVEDIDNAWVAFHPERRVMLFGVRIPSRFAGGTIYPNVIWAWDVMRDVWQHDWDLNGTEVLFATPSATSTGLAPTSPPNSLVLTVATVVGYTATWVNGDATAETEVWDRPGAGGTWGVRHTEAPAGTTEVVPTVLKTITSSSAANPTNILATAHGILTGDIITIQGHSGQVGWPSINGPSYVVNFIDPDNFTIPVNLITGGTGGTFTITNKNRPHYREISVKVR
ncbi:hypothetical protein LCGC14_2700870, partial [marine sediment metagenome]